uniref:Elongator complex protein 6 n=1 Tax=Talaromyces marneffei PM1 TaxID=1077442 RepID=A0A093VHX5_TALMA
MPSQPPIPHILSPYLTHSTHSAQSLTIITSVLAATPNWLVLRYLHSVLSAATEHGQTHPYQGGKKRRRAKRVVLVSFLRDWLFWRGEGKRLGLDLQRFVEGNRLRFVDGLSGLFDAPQQQPAPPQGNSRAVPTGGAMGSGRSIPMRGSVGPASIRGPPTISPLATTPSQAKIPTLQQQQKQLHLSGQGTTALNQLENDILSVIKSFPNPNATNETGEEEEEDDEDDILLILDQPDLILATTPGIDANDMSEWVMGLQQHVLSTIITTSADTPLIHNANPYTANDSTATPLEKNHASFVVGLAHRADMVLQLRTLDTGAAKDVSGVLRISRGGGYQPELEGKEDEVIEKEALYFVQRDGGVRVFGRGEV